MNSSRSIVETVIKELADQPDMFQYPHARLPSDFGGSRSLLTPKGLEYVQQPRNLERYWGMNVKNFQPGNFDGNITRGPDGHVTLDVKIDSFSVVVVGVRAALEKVVI